MPYNFAQNSRPVYLKAAQNGLNVDHSISTSNWLSRYVHGQHRSSRKHRAGLRTTFSQIPPARRKSMQSFREYPTNPTNPFPRIHSTTSPTPESYIRPQYISCFIYRVLLVRGLGVCSIRGKGLLRVDLRAGPQIVGISHTCNPPWTSHKNIMFLLIPYRFIILNPKIAIPKIPPRSLQDPPQHDKKGFKGRRFQIQVQRCP